MNYDELEFFKSIDLVDFAMKHGFYLDKTKGVKGKYISLKKNDEKIRITRALSGDYLFFDNDDRTGNIIHFCANYLNIRNLAEVKKYLKNFSGSSSAPDVEIKTERISKEEIENLKEIEKNQYLERERFINIYNKMRYNKIFSDERNNLCFQLRDKDGISGIFKYGIKNFKSVQGKKGLFIEGNIKAKKIIIGEAILDVLSYIQIKNLDFSDDFLYVATCGRFSQDIKNYLKLIIEKLEFKDLNILGVFDNDDTGLKLFQEIQDVLKNIKDKNIFFEKDSPKLKDWNDDLKEQFKEKKNSRNNELKIELLKLANQEFIEKRFSEREKKLEEILNSNNSFSISKIADLLGIDRSTIYRNKNLLALIKSVATR